jgi:tetratricopeptide (TPR) repeat protein
VQTPDRAGPVVALAQSWYAALALMVWPHPLRIIHYADHVSPWLAFASQIALVVTALLLLLRRRNPGLLAGLVIFYLAVLPVTVYTAFAGHGVSIQERYLYLPSVGLSVVLGFILSLLAGSKGPRIAVIVSVLALLAMLPATWARNGDWANNIALFESDYRRGEPSSYLLSQLVQAHNAAGDYSQSARYCDRHKERVDGSDALSEDCGWTYQRLQRMDDAERAFLRAAQSQQTGAAARRKLAELYLGQGRRKEAQEQFDLSIGQERSPAMQEYRKAHRAFALYPNDARRLREADSHLERALELQPGLVIAAELRQQVAEKLENLQH